MAVGVGMAVVDVEAALVQVGALGVAVLHRLTGVEGARALDGGAAKVAVDARALYRVLLDEAPAAVEAAQAGGAVPEHAARLALMVAVRVAAAAAHDELVDPLAAQPELVLAGVDAEAEALLRLLAPHALALVVEALLARGALVACRRALHRRLHAGRRATAPLALGVVVPPLARRLRRARLARDEIAAVDALVRVHDEVAPVVAARLPGNHRGKKNQNKKNENVVTDFFLIFEVLVRETLNFANFCLRLANYLKKFQKFIKNFTTFKKKLAILTVFYFLNFCGKEINKFFKFC